MKIRGDGGRAPGIRNLGLRWGWSVSSLGRFKTGTHWVDIRADVDLQRKISALFGIEPLIHDHSLRSLDSLMNRTECVNK